MEFSIVTDTIEDAEDLFLLAKERLLDVNNWHELYSNDFRIQCSLTDAREHLLHRNAHTRDFVKITGVFPETLLYLSHIQYDDFPDVLGESITINLDAANAHNAGIRQPIIIKRIGKIIMVQSGTQFLIPLPDQFLKALIATGVYAIAAY